MKELEDVLQLLPYSPYIYGSFDVINNVYICTAIIKNNNISNRELIDIENINQVKNMLDDGSLWIWNGCDGDIYVSIAKALSEVTFAYYQSMIKSKITESVWGEDFIFGMIVEQLRSYMVTELHGNCDIYFQFIKSFATITQKVFDVCTVVTDIEWFDNEDERLWELFGLKFGKVLNGSDKNPILRIAKIAKEAEVAEGCKSENVANINNQLSNNKNTNHITVWNGRERVLFDLNAEEKPKLLLHICCAPDLTYPLYWLKRYFKLYLFWYNPNIHPRREHDLRYEQYLKLFQLEEGDYEIVEDWYDPKEFFASFPKYRKLIKDGLEELSDNEVLKVAGDMEERSARCDPCYLMRLEQAASMAAKLDIPYFTSTLLISPKKVATKLFRRGLGAQERVVKSKFLRFDFAKKDGYNKASELTKDYDLYRQNYCGCGWTIPKKWEPVKEYKWG